MSLLITPITQFLTDPGGPIVSNLINETSWRPAGNASPSIDETRLRDTGNALECATKNRAYLSIIITVIPLWILLTTLIVFVLLSFHKSLRSTKIYDDCNKNTAHHSYYIELRTGDTSATYNRRRTAITIDMFDENQQSLARVALPAHVIFGRKNNPIGVIEDEKFFELRVTRFWLFRAVKLKRVATIRLTHSCLEPEAKIMVYGLEIRTNEPEEQKQFFPIMSYISAFGSSSKQNACFDLEPAGTIAVMGGAQDDTGFVSGNLSRADYTILLYLLSSIVWFFTSHKNLFLTGDDTALLCLYRGALIGLISYSIVLLVGLCHRYFVKHYYALNIGLGPRAIVYYATSVLMLLTGTAFWILATVYAYRRLCPTLYSDWILTIAFSMIEVIALAVLNALIFWSYHLLNPKTNEQYMFPDDYSFGQPGGASESQQSRKGGAYNSAGASNAFTAGGSRQTALSQAFPQQPMASWPPGPTLHQIATLQPPAGQAHYNGYGQALVYAAPQAPAPHFRPPEVLVQLPAGSGPVLGQAPPAASMSQQQQQPQTPQLHKSYPTPDGQNYHAQMATGSNQPAAAGGKKRAGSTESTGSNYYQQLMKNKGGVKSISQYGELLKQKKATHNNPAGRHNK